MSSPRTYEVRGLRLRYEEYGDPQGRRLLCLHGFLDHGASYRFMAEALPNTNIVAPDMRGHGASDWVGPGGYYHFYDYFDDCRALIEHLGWARFGLLGHSMGGSIATGLAALEPERVAALILLEGMGPPYSDLGETVGRLRRWSDELRRPVRTGGPQARRRSRKVMPDLADVARRLRVVNGRLPADRAQRLAESMTEPGQTGGRVWRADPLHRTPAAKPFLREEAEALWRGVRAPTLSLQGGESWWRLDDLDDRHRVLSSVTAKVIPNAGHNLHHDQPEAVAAEVDAWLMSHFSSAPTT